MPSNDVAMSYFWDEIPWPDITVCYEDTQGSLFE
jgi:hypothetical protein